MMVPIPEVNFRGTHPENRAQHKHHQTSIPKARNGRNGGCSEHRLVIANRVWSGEAHTSAQQAPWACEIAAADQASVVSRRDSAGLRKSTEVRLAATDWLIL